MHSLLTDHSERFLSSFVVQYCYYLSAHFASSGHYARYFVAAARADQLYWKLAAPSAAGGVWGCGAGAYPSDIRNGPYGYHACAIDDNAALVYSAPVVAGFLPTVPETAELLLHWRARGDACCYETTVTTPSAVGGSAQEHAVHHVMLWRASLTHPEWRAPTIEAVDYAPFMLGCAAHVLGHDFFRKHAAGAGMCFEPEDAGGGPRACSQFLELECSVA